MSPVTASPGDGQQAAYDYAELFAGLTTRSGGQASPAQPADHA
jgi:hypothetical protein